MLSEEEKVQIVIEAKNLAGPQMEEARMLARNFKEAIDSMNRSTAEGATVAQAMKQAMNELSRGALEAGLTFEETKNVVTDTRQAMQRYIEVVSAGMAPQEAYNLVLDQTIAEMAAVSNETKSAAASQAALDAANGLSIPGWLALAGKIAGVLLVLAPFVALLSSAVVVVTSFAVGAAAMAAVLGAASVGFLGLGVLVVGLADHFAWVNNSMGKFKNDLNAMGIDLASKAAPAANEILKFLDRLLPMLDKVGSGLLRWFSGELPKALSMISTVFNDLTPAFQQFGDFLGAVFDHVGPQIGPMFEALTKFSLGAIEGLISNLVRISDWFQKELPVMGPVVSQIFGKIGDIITGVASAFGRLGDWFAQQWPSFSKTFGDAWSKAFGPGSAFASTAKQDLPQLTKALTDLFTSSPSWIPVLAQLGSALLGIATGLAKIADVTTQLVGWINSHAPWIWNLVIGGQTNFHSAGGGATEWAGLAGSAGTGVGGAGGGRVLHFASGGTVPGAPGAPMPAIVHGGETVTSNDAQDRQIEVLEYIASVLVAMLNQGPGGTNYSALANLEYNRARGLA